MSSESHAGLQIPLTLVLIMLALVYMRGWYQLRSARPNVLPVGRLVAFISGVFVLWAAAGSSLAALDHELLTVHMVQHLAIMTVAAPLILLGVPPVLLPRRFPHPVFCWLASTLTVIGWHIPALFALGMRSAGWHQIEQASFFAAGLLFWWPIFQSWPSLASGNPWWLPLYLFLATLPCDALSAFLTFCNRVVYPHYFTAKRPFPISPLGDQEFAGALMWVCVTFAYLVPAALATMQMLSPSKLTSKAQVV